MDYEGGAFLVEPRRTSRLLFAWLTLSHAFRQSRVVLPVAKLRGGG